MAKKIPHILKEIKKVQVPEIDYTFNKNISYSQLSIYSNCPYQWGLRYRDGFKVFDALNQEHVDWWKSGIMDPLKVTLTALDNAISVAQLLITCGGVISIEDNEELQKIRQMQDGMLKAIEGDVIA